MWIHRSWPMQQCRDESEIYGRFPFNPKFWIGVSNGTDHYSLVQPKYSGPALKVVHFDRSGHFGPFPFDKIVVPSTALLYPAYKNNNQTRGGLVRVCATGMYHSIGHVELPKLQTGIFVEPKAPCNYQLTAQIPNNRCGYTGHFYCPKWPFYHGKLAG